MPRVLLFTGKGGVGKTTCAAATALACAKQGKRTLVLSTDPAHSLADAVDRPLGPEPQEIAPRLDAMEVDMYYSMRKYWGNMRELVRAVLRFQGADAIAAEELAALPGMGEGSALLWLDQFYRSGDYDVIVLDAAPTGETLTLLTLPQVTQWWLQKAFPLQKTAIKTVGFAVRKTTGIPLDRGYEELDALFGKLGEVQEVLQDPQVTSARLVMNPERMVIQEAKRAYTYLQLYGYGVDAAIVNRVVPEDEAGGVMAKYVEAQAGYLREIEETFAPLPVLRVPHLGQEVFGLDLLEQIGAGLYADRDPAAVYHAEPSYTVENEGDAYTVSIKVPYADDADVEAEQFGDDLVVQVRNQRRNVTLPAFLAYYRLASAGVDGGWLRARFVPEP
ncbi:ArsA family ATPase [Rubrivirga sp. S365]|uniref:arsenite-transporting ATPase n=1 Tax=Rubrivirga litoralis TaxID=3075598 RepID=A0ABU3BPT1_9BACT|nr:MULTISPECIES: ArsA family ATPase [unclassified Rubrivirga]MDT0631294.1 ArsA family ATPase [Rubrivirga sp. F394]MDT7856002.1 ArsA family ATPase [Rubrivirga sp. S365]